MKYVLILIYTGLRPAELLQITNSRLDLENKVLIAGIKTEKGIDREIPLCDKIIPLLENIKIDFNYNIFYKSYKKAFARTSIRFLPPHCCRHTTATALVLAGVETKIITDILGHKSFSVTADNYVHIPLDEKITAVNKIK
jgi:integrase